VADMFSCCSSLYMIAVSPIRKCLKVVGTFLYALHHQMKSTVDRVCWILKSLAEIARKKEFIE
jgi:hypothetical protein